MNLSNTEAFILTMLDTHEKELYGLQMRKLSGTYLKRGTIYVTLSRMEDKKYLSSRQTNVCIDGINKNLRVYKITDLGKRVLLSYDEKQRAIEKIFSGWRGGLI